MIDTKLKGPVSRQPCAPEQPCELQINPYKQADLSNQSIDTKQLDDLAMTAINDNSEAYDVSITDNNALFMEDVDANDDIELHEQYGPNVTDEPTADTCDQYLGVSILIQSTLCVCVCLW